MSKLNHHAAAILIEHVMPAGKLGNGQRHAECSRSPLDVLDVTDVKGLLLSN